MEGPLIFSNWRYTFFFFLFLLCLIIFVHRQLKGIKREWLRTLAITTQFIWNCMFYSLLPLPSPFFFPLLIPLSPPSILILVFKGLMGETLKYHQKTYLSLHPSWVTLFLFLLRVMQEESCPRTLRFTKEGLIFRGMMLFQTLSKTINS